MISLLARPPYLVKTFVVRIVAELLRVELVLQMLNPLSRSGRIMRLPHEGPAALGTQ